MPVEQAVHFAIQEHWFVQVSANQLWRHLGECRTGALGMARRVGGAHGAGLAPAHGAAIALDAHDGAVEVGHAGVGHAVSPAFDR